MIRFLNDGPVDFGGERRMTCLALAGLVALALMLAGCEGGVAPSLDEALTPAATQPWLSVNDFLYQLQNLSLANAGASKFDLIVMDYSRYGDGASAWTPGQIAALRNSAGGPKRLLAYMSIGEAEDYRYYWRSWWRPGSPAWLLAENADWPGNYRVRYWSPAWQGIIFGSAGAYLDRIIAQGFDGVYLDLVDSYELFPGHATARQEMIAFVRALSAYAKSKRPGFRIVPQNAAELVQDAQYLAAIDGIGQEELSYGWEGNDGMATPPAVRSQLSGYLTRAKQAGKLVLVTDYTRNTTRINLAYQYAAAHGFVDYCTVRNLDRLIVNAGHEPD